MTDRLVERPEWIEQTLDLFQSHYINSVGIIITAVDKTGRIVDATPLIADFGDVLPFLAFFGRKDFVDRQVQLAQPHLSHSLFGIDGRVKLFDNHDWLLGLLELNEISHDPILIDIAKEGAKEIIEKMFVRGFLIDEALRWNAPRTWLMQASPFNGGYIELWIDLFQSTGDRAFLDASERLAGAWGDSAKFRETGIFHRELCAYSPLLGVLLRGFASLSARLFKDNTNFLWSLLALYQTTRNPRWGAMITLWVSGFRRSFLSGGDVLLWIDQQGRGQEVSLKAAFSSIDLLCDLHMGGFVDGTLEMAETIARRWESHRWDNGLFPELPMGVKDHLDANVDMSIALLKLAALTGRSEYARQAQTTANAVVDHHNSPLGLVQAVSRDGAVADGRVIVKYQSLALKLAIAPADPADFIADSALLKLLRDR